MKYTRKFDTVSAYESAELDYPNMSYIVEDDSVRYVKTAPPHDYSHDYLTFVALEDGTFKFSGNSVNYSLDNGTTWAELASDTDSPTVESGQTILWKGTLSPSTYGIGRFSSTGMFNAQGNVMSLLYGDNFTGQTSLANYNNAFKYLFYRCYGLINSENMILPATTLRFNCYEGMFAQCSALTAVPELPATTLANNCYQSMFSYCNSLTAAPELPATTLANNCYQSMFAQCSALTAAPELPATTLANNCYQSMFSGCKSLVVAPELPATTLVYSCYQEMFSGCTSLNNITCLATNLANNCTYRWVLNVSSTGTFTKAASMTDWTTGDNGIPSNWTVQDAS